MKEEPKKELPPGYVSPLDLISMIFWGQEEGARGPATETMTTAEVLAYHKTSRAQLTRWKDEGVLLPVSRGRYDLAIVCAFVPPQCQEEKDDA